MTRRPWLLLAALLASACTNGYSSGVDGSKPVSSLTVAEATTACLNLGLYYQEQLTEDDFVRFRCYGLALSDVTATPTQCQAQYDACQADPPAVDPPTVDCTNAMSDSSCNARVSQLESCITARVQQQRDFIAGLDCSVAGNVPELMRLREPLPLPPECTAIQDICPGAGNI